MSLVRIWEKIIINAHNIGVMMQKLSEEEAKRKAEEYNLKPVRIKKSEVVQLAKMMSERYEEITWEEFFRVLREKRLAVYISKSGYMKIMSDDIYE